MTGSRKTPAEPQRRPRGSIGHCWLLTTVIDALQAATGRAARFWRVSLSGDAA